MTIFLEKLNESFVRIKASKDIIQQLDEYFTFRAKNYQFMQSYKNSNWDGMIRLLQDDLLPLGLLDHLNTFATKNKIEIKGNKLNKILIENKNIIEFIKKLDKKFIPRLYQIKALFTALKENKCVIQLPTASGKSYLLYAYIKYIIEHYKKYNKILLIVPKKSLVFQMRDEFENYECGFSQRIHTIVAGSEKDSEKEVHISTWQSLYQMKPSHFHRYGTLIIDECHHAKANSIRTISKNCINATFRLGTTATIENNNYKFIILGNLGKIYEFEKTKNLINKKLLSNVTIYHLLLKHPFKTRLFISAVETNFNFEIKKALENKRRYEIIIESIKCTNKNCLVLFKRIKFGKKLYEDLKEQIKDRHIYYIDGKIKNREDIRKNMENEKDSILLASSQIFSTGVNIKNLHYIIITLFNKSKISVMQTIGRGLRLHETKDKIRVIDFVDDMQLRRKERNEILKKRNMELSLKRNILLQHFYDRIKIYKEEKFIFKIKRINL